jgi:hypothetical protein
MNAAVFTRSVRYGLREVVRRATLREMRLTTILLLLSAAAAFVIVLCGIAVLFDAYSALPYWDQWEYISPAVIFRRYFEQHNEHRILLTKLIMFTDQAVFGGSNLLNFAIIYLTQALHAWFLTVLAWRAGLRSYSEILPAALTILATLFTVHQFENLTWGFQTQFVIVFAAATAAFLSVARYAETGRSINLVATVLASAIATSEMANGVLVAMIVVVMAITLRLGWRIVLILAVVAALLPAAYLIDYSPVAHHSSIAESIGHPLQLVGYVCTYIGGIAARTLTAGPFEFVGRFIPEPRLALICGAVVSLINILVVVRVAARRADIPPAICTLLAINLFVAGTAAITGLGRMGFGLDQALASRYSTGGAIIIAVTFILVLALAAPLRPPIARFAGAACLILLTLLAIAQPRFIRSADERRIGNDLATSALLSEVTEPDALHMTFLHVDYIMRGASYLKGRNLSIFADSWSQWLGRPLGEFTPLPRSTCPGRINELLPIPRTDGARISGAVTFSPFMLRPRVVLIDARARVVGYAFVQHHIDLVAIYRPVRRPTVDIGWLGHVRNDHVAPLRAVLTDRNNAAICFIGSD